mgnify:CR=1 FL=1
MVDEMPVTIRSFVAEDYPVVAQILQEAGLFYDRMDDQKHLEPVQNLPHAIS